MYVTEFTDDNAVFKIFLNLITICVFIEQNNELKFYKLNWIEILKSIMTFIAIYAIKVPVWTRYKSNETRIHKLSVLEFWYFFYFLLFRKWFFFYWVLLTCRFRSSVMRDIWIFFLPMLAIFVTEQCFLYKIFFDFLKTKFCVCMIYKLYSLLLLLFSSSIFPMKFTKDLLSVCAREIVNSLFRGAPLIDFVFSFN